jgi:hypothetical protein
MRLIIGATTKVRNVGKGAFLCPACRSDANYVRVRASRYLTFFFIPLFPMRTIGEYIQCESCHTDLGPEVAKLTREQVQQITAPWLCPSCRNLNSATEKTCLACGAARQQGPPPIPGTSAPLSAAQILTPPPLAALGPSGKKSIIGRIFLILVGLALLNILVGIGMALWSGLHSKETPAALEKKPGDSEFTEATRSISNDGDGVAHGNTAEARELAAKVSKGLGEVFENTSTVSKPDTLDHTGGKFLVFCQMNPDACVFLIHVPNLRHYDSQAQRSIAEGAYMQACVVLKESGATNIRHVAVATRGILFYSDALLGSFPPQTPDLRKHLQTLTTQATDVPALYPYFAAETAEKESPVSSEKPEKPAAPGKSGTPAKPEAPAATAPSETPATPAAPATPATPAPAAPARATPTPATPTPATAATLSAPATPETPVNGRPVLDAKALPSWVPVYPNLLRPAHGTRRENNGVTKGMATCETADPLDKVKEFYENRLKADGFEITADKSTARLFENAEIDGRKEDGNLTLRVAIHQMKARTNVFLTYSGAENAEAAR